jgi:hypothetical protein
MTSNPLSHKKRSGLVLAALAGACVLLGAAGAAPAPFQLVFDGHHVPLAASPNGLGHAGTFTASAPFCSAGNAADERVFVGQQVSSRRVYTCDDGSGSMTVLMVNIPGEHAVGGNGTWQVIGGTGAYAKLRGSGTWSTLSVQGDEGNLAALSFRSKMQGTALIDEVAPSAGFSKVSARKLVRPTSAYLIKVVFFARDDQEVGASYRLKASIGARTLASKAGQTASRAMSVSLTVRPPKGTRALQLALTATDSVGNTRTVQRSLKLPA